MKAGTIQSILANVSMLCGMAALAYDEWATAGMLAFVMVFCLGTALWFKD